MTMRPCPRCNEPFDDRYSAASRAVDERDIQVCGPCGTDEAGYDAREESLPKVAQWPVARRYGRDLGEL